MLWAALVFWIYSVASSVFVRPVAAHVSAIHKTDNCRANENPTSSNVKERPMFQLASFSLSLSEICLFHLSSHVFRLWNVFIFTHFIIHVITSSLSSLKSLLLFACPFFALGPLRHSNVPHNYLSCAASTHVSMTFQLPDPLTSLAQMCSHFMACFNTFTTATDSLSWIHPVARHNCAATTSVITRSFVHH